AALVYGAYEIRAALVPFVLSFALAYLANPVVALFEARGLRRDHAVLALYGVIASCVSISANFIVPAVTSELSLLQSQVPLYLHHAQEYLVGMQAHVAKRVPFGHAVIEHVSLRMYEPLMDHLQHIPSYVLSLVPFITFYMLMDSSRIIRHAIQACPSRYVEQALHLLCEIDSSLGNYLRGV